jgi:hypothetical protein
MSDQSVVESAAKGLAAFAKANGCVYSASTDGTFLQSVRKEIEKTAGVDVYVFDPDEMMRRFERVVRQFEESDEQRTCIAYGCLNKSFFDFADFDNVSRRRVSIVWQSASGQWFTVRFLEVFEGFAGEPVDITKAANLEKEPQTVAAFVWHSCIFGVPVRGNTAISITKLDEKSALEQHQLHERLCGYSGCENTNCAMKCAGCEDTRYCSAEHQRLDWKPRHKEACGNKTLRLMNTRYKALPLRRNEAVKK